MSFTIPKAPKIQLKAKPPDQRKIAVIPLRALRDKELNNQSIRVLGLICSYANRAGITWVANNTLAKELQVSKQAISQQVVALKKKGYLEVIRKGYIGQRTDTLRVIYDPSITATDALAILGNEDDLKSPLMLIEELKAMNQPALKKPIKKSKAIAKVNKEIEDNKEMDYIKKLYMVWFKKEKVIKENDVIAISKVKDSGIAMQQYLDDLTNWIQMIAAENLAIPDDILPLTNKILSDRGL
jgi:predicted DNA-binding transcriptional regulator